MRLMSSHLAMVYVAARYRSLKLFLITRWPDFFRFNADGLSNDRLALGPLCLDGAAQGPRRGVPVVAGERRQVPSVFLERGNDVGRVPVDSALFLACRFGHLSLPCVNFVASNLLQRIEHCNKLLNVHVQSNLAIRSV